MFKHFKFKSGTLMADVPIDDIVCAMLCKIGNVFDTF